jgi:hypothetical protein
MTETNGTLVIGEFHPATHSAYRYAKSRLMTDLYLLEALASTALSGNRQSEICYETAQRILSSAPVSDRYVLGLAWTLKMMEEMESISQYACDSNQSNNL